MKITLGVAHRFQIFNESLSVLLSSHPKYQVRVVGYNAATIMDGMRQDPVEVLIIDPFYDDRDTLDLVADLLNQSPGLKLVALLGCDRPHLARRLVKAGVRGLFSPSGTQQDLMEMLAKVTKDQPHFAPEFSSAFYEEEENLTSREEQVLRHLAMGMSKVVLAERLGISPKTVDSHRANLLRKLRLKNNTELLRYALREGLIRNDD